MSDLNATELYNSIYKITKDFPETETLRMSKLITILEEKYKRSFSPDDRVLIKKQALKAAKQIEEEENEVELRPLKKKKEEMPEFIDLGSNGKKRASVSQFKGKKYLNLREYYEDPYGEMKPTKKGIMLDYDAYLKLKENLDLIEKMFNA